MTPSAAAGTPVLRSPLAIATPGSESTERPAGMSTRSPTGPTTGASAMNCLGEHQTAQLCTEEISYDKFLNSSSTPQTEQEMALRLRFHRAFVTFRLTDASRYFPYCCGASADPESLTGILFRCGALSEYKTLILFDVETTKKLLATITPGREFSRIQGDSPSPMQIDAKKEDTRSKSWDWSEKGPVAYMRTITPSRQNPELYHYVHMVVERTGTEGGFDKLVRVTFTVEVARRTRNGDAMSDQVLWSVEARGNANEVPLMVVSERGHFVIP
ncbi:hypothetical protein JKP88DRAFT_285308 [Tribonema minus]|uniref:Uncharacterized protein n=1 Tax=Tribonema minus TaxID=303371 RepID=A0A836CMY5_9STRA|nr:hypothetical protein JKP88DRAFT_285308 [Tribonema minus]